MRDELHSSLWREQENYQAPKGPVGNRCRKYILIDGTKQEAWTSLEMRPVLVTDMLEAAQDKYDENCAKERPEPKVRHQKSYKKRNSD